MGRPKGGSITDWDDEPLGVEPDIEIADRLGVSRQAVALQRLKRGLKAKWPRGQRGENVTLREVVERVLNRHHYSVQSSQVWREVMDEYGEVSHRTVQRVLAKLR